MVKLNAPPPAPSLSIPAKVPLEVWSTVSNAAVPLPLRITAEVAVGSEDKLPMAMLLPFRLRVPEEEAPKVTLSGEVLLSAPALFTTTSALFSIDRQTVGEGVIATPKTNSPLPATVSAWAPADGAANRERRSGTERPCLVAAQSDVGVDRLSPGAEGGGDAAARGVSVGAGGVDRQSIAGDGDVRAAGDCCIRAGEVQAVDGGIDSEHACSTLEPLLAT